MSADLITNSKPWDMKTIFLNKIKERGGFTCHHAHFDKAYLISNDNLVLSQRDMQDKWRLYRELKKSYTFKDLYERISRAVEKMIEQGVTHCRSFIDADELVGSLPLQAALGGSRRLLPPNPFGIRSSAIRGSIRASCTESIRRSL